MQTENQTRSATLGREGREGLWELNNRKEVLEFEGQIPSGSEKERVEQEVQTEPLARCSNKRGGGKGSLRDALEDPDEVLEVEEEPPEVYKPPEDLEYIYKIPGAGYWGSPGSGLCECHCSSWCFHCTQ